MMLWLLMLVGCTTEKKEEQASYVSPLAPPEPELDIASLQTAVVANLQKGFPSPVQLRNLYGSFLTRRETWCPHMENANSGTWHGVWFDDCTTTDGYSFWGTAVFFEFTDPNWSMEAMASYQLTDPQGYEFVGGGEYELDFVPEESWFFRVGGTFTYEPYGGWFAERGEASLFLHATFDAEVMDAQLDGGIGFDDLELYFDALHVNDDECSGLPQGNVMIRDSSTFWFVVPLQDCSPCGDLVWNGESKGEICIGEEIRTALHVMRSEVESGP